ncbi:hypothetical protein BDV93DRAFT_556907 [Ceratobasidium sp. AG-I]|nr:hypothetical protein BDV93DRAFT_556907 [Ceratobasidium sp. AG-I]
MQLGIQPIVHTQSGFDSGHQTILLPPTPVSLQPLPRLPCFDNGTPTPMPVRLIRRVSLLLLPAPSFGTSAAPLPALTIPPLPVALAATATTFPVMSTKNEDLRAARVALAKLDNFDDKGKSMREAEWRHQFIIATRDLDDTQRAQLWADKLVYEGEAYKWLGNLTRGTADEQADVVDWAKLAI